MQMNVNRVKKINAGVVDVAYVIQLNFIILKSFFSFDSVCSCNIYFYNNKHRRRGKFT